MVTMEVSNSSLIELIDAWKLRDELLDEAIDDSKRRLELLREIIARVSFCPICMAGYLNDSGTYEHADDCRLEKELSDERQ